MKFALIPLLVALSLSSGSALAVITTYTIAPGATLSPADGEEAVYTGVVSKSGGSFTDSYTIDFNNYTHSDEWTFQVVGTSLDLNGNHLTGLSGLSMSLYDASNSLLWTVPAVTSYSNSVATPAGTLTVIGLNAYSDAIYSPSTYHLTVSGSGAGFYDITASIPEPKTWAIFMAGIALVGLRLRNHKNMLS